MSYRAPLRRLHGTQDPRCRAGGKAAAERRGTPPAPKSGTWAAPSPARLAADLRLAADDADEVGLSGSAQRMRALASDLDADGSAEGVREVARLIAYAVARAQAEGDAGAVVLELWERVLPRGVVVDAGRGG